ALPIRPGEAVARLDPPGRWGCPGEAVAPLDTPPSTGPCGADRSLLPFRRCSRPGAHEGPREGGASPPRPRHCNRGRNPREPLAVAGWEGAGSRTIREPGDLPGRSRLNRSSREGPGDSIVAPGTWRRAEGEEPFRARVHGSSRRL